MRNFYILLVGLMMGAPAVQWAQGTDKLPKVFVIGEHEQEFEQLTLEHSTMMLSVCNDDMNVAFDKWWSMMQEMEAYANLIKYDLKGLKLWLNVFWEKDGKIRHIAYYLKPNSRFVDTRDLTAFFSSFMNHYSFPLISKDLYSHYGTASFPTTPKFITQPNADSDKPLVKDSSNY